MQQQKNNSVYPDVVQAHLASFERTPSPTSSRPKKLTKLPCRKVSVDNSSIADSDVLQALWADKNERVAAPSNDTKTTSVIMNPKGADDTTAAPLAASVHALGLVCIGWNGRFWLPTCMQTLKSCVVGRTSVQFAMRGTHVKQHLYFANVEYAVSGKLIKRGLPVSERSSGLTL